MARAGLPKYSWLAAVSLVAAAGAAVASVVPASASSGITVQAFTLPSGQDAVLSAPGAIGQGLNGEQWFVTANSSSTDYGLAEATNDGTVKVLNPSLAGGGGGTYPALVNRLDGSVWLLGDNATNLSALDSGGGQHVVDTGMHDDHDIALGPDGRLYATGYGDGVIYQYSVTGTASATLDHSYSTGSSMFLDAIASAGGKLWFSDDSGDLHSMTTGGTTKEITTAGNVVSDGAHTLVGGANGYLWAIAYGSTGYGSSILKIDTFTGGVVHTYSSGIPADASLTAITVGADGDLWFPEAGVDKIGQLDPATGTIKNYALPSGFALPTPADKEGYDIAPGPGNTLWFTAQTSDGSNAAVGEVSGLTVTTTTTTSGTTSNTTSATSTTSNTTTSMTMRQTPPGRPNKCKRGKARRHGRCVARHKHHHRHHKKHHENKKR